MSASRLTGIALLCILSGCEQPQFGFAAGAEKFSIPRVAADSRAAACFHELAEADARVRPDATGWRQLASLGTMSQQAYRKTERQRQREWDQHYCRRQAECRTLASPTSSATDIAHSVDLCLAHRAQQRVAMQL